MTPLPPNWWRNLCALLRLLKISPGYVCTRVNKVPNYILVVDEQSGFLKLLSQLSRQNHPRIITREMIESPDSKHGVIRRDLRELAMTAPAVP